MFKGQMGMGVSQEIGLYRIFVLDFRDKVELYSLNKYFTNCRSLCE